MVIIMLSMSSTSSHSYTAASHSYTPALTYIHYIPSHTTIFIPTHAYIPTHTYISLRYTFPLLHVFPLLLHLTSYPHSPYLYLQTLTCQVFRRAFFPDRLVGRGKYW
jgi:hypothetical protein